MQYSNVVLVRGINVGGKNSLPMAELRSAIESIGGGESQTYIQSGNAVCTHPIDPDELSDEIERRVGFRPAVITLSSDAFIAAIDASPFALSDGDGKDVHVFFAQEPAEFDIDAARSVATATERIDHIGRCVYLSAPDGIGRSKLAASVERFASAPLTARNARTIGKLVSLLGAEGGR